jgi:HK97 family phage prohead protease
MKNQKLLSSQKVVKAFTFETKAVDDKQYTIEGIFSTPVVDRHEEVVLQEGWNLAEYMLNPVVLWSHDNYQFPLAQMTEIKVEDGKLIGKMKFAVDEYEMAATAFKLMQGKFLRAFSVGFINNVYEVDNDTDVIKLIENTLLEVSIVNVPANQEALAKIKTIDFLKEREETDEELENKALETIKKSKKETIEAAIRTLTEVLKSISKADNQVEQGRNPSKKGGNKQISAEVFNQAVRELLKVKKMKL